MFNGGCLICLKANQGMDDGNLHSGVQVLDTADFVLNLYDAVSDIK